MRLKIIRVIIYSLFVMMALNLIFIQVIKGQYFSHLSRNNRIRIVPLEGSRGRIFDKNGVSLAMNRPSWDVMIVPQEIRDEEITFHFLSQVLRIDKKILLEQYRKRAFAPFAPVLVVQDISKEKAFAIEENKYQFPGLLIEERFKRIYPHQDKTAHVLGYVGRINRSRLEQGKDYGYVSDSIVGYSGIEEYYDNYLRGEMGGLQIEVNNRGQQVRVLGIKEPFEGQDITLSIDSRIQQIAAGLLEDKVGTIIVMNMENGEILGMVSSPSYDPNIFTDNSNGQGKINKTFSPFFNRATSGQFPPGSVFKIPIALCALQSKKIHPTTTYSCRGAYDLGGIRFRCSHEHGPQNLIEAITHSCNVYFYHLSLTVGIEGLRRCLETFVLGDRTNIDLPSEASGFIPGPGQRVDATSRRWYQGDTVNFSIGQGEILATPLQMVNMMATVATGKVVQPHLIKAVSSASIERFSLVKRIPISEEHLEVVRKGLRSVVNLPSGTAHSLDIPDLFVAGKTGTAQTVAGKDHHAWFVGYSYFPTTKIVFCVFLEYGGSSQHACQVARELLLRLKEEEIL